MSVKGAQIPRATVAYDVGNMNAIVNVIDQRVRDLERSAATGYTTPNSAINRTLDASTATLTTTINVLQTLIADLKNKGFLA